MSEHRPEETEHSFTVRARIRTPRDGASDDVEKRIEEAHELWEERIRKAVDEIPGAYERGVRNDGWSWLS